VAIVSEVIGTAGLKASLSLQQISLGVAYAIWSGLGTVLVGVMVWQESLGPARLIGLIVIGVVLSVFAEGSRT
jgi:multidrug transporter EmrE-like cation transporter